MKPAALKPESLSHLEGMGFKSFGPKSLEELRPWGRWGIGLRVYRLRVSGSSSRA